MRRTLSLVIMIVGLMGTAAFARPAETMPPMRFELARLADEACAPACPRWIAAEGRITKETPAVFERFMRRAGVDGLPVVVHSPGGDVDAAMRLGSRIRSLGLTVAVGRTSFTGCSPFVDACEPSAGARPARPVSRRAYCNSACPLMLAGGVERLAGSAAAVGVHQITTTVRRSRQHYEVRYRVIDGQRREVDRRLVRTEPLPPETTTVLSDRMRARLVAHYRRMGIDIAFLDSGLRVPATSVRRIVPEALARWRVITTRRPVEALLAAERCAAADRPAFCGTD